MSGQAGAVTERDREIEVTPEMAEAGAAIIYKFNDDTYASTSITLREAARQVFLEMMSLR